MKELILNLVIRKEMDSPLWWSTELVTPTLQCLWFCSMLQMQKFYIFYSLTELMQYVCKYKVKASFTAQLDKNQALIFFQIFSKTVSYVISSHVDKPLGGQHVLMFKSLG